MALDSPVPVFSFNLLTLVIRLIIPIARHWLKVLSRPPTWNLMVTRDRAQPSVITSHTTTSPSNFSMGDNTDLGGVEQQPHCTTFDDLHLIFGNLCMLQELLPCLDHSRNTLQGCSSMALIVWRAAQAMRLDIEAVKLKNPSTPFF